MKVFDVYVLRSYDGIERYVAIDRGLPAPPEPPRHYWTRQVELANDEAAAITQTQRTLSAVRGAIRHALGDD